MGAGGMNRCNGCAALRFEEWPKGALAAKCTRPPKTMQLTEDGERVLEIFFLGNPGAVMRPMWCAGRRKKNDNA